MTGPASPFSFLVPTMISGGFPFGSFIWWLWILSTVTGLFCEFSDLGCLNPLAQQGTPVTFSSLFPAPIRFIYSFDYHGAFEHESAHYVNSIGTHYHSGPTIKVSYWLEYGQQRPSPSSKKGNWTSEVALRIGNLTGVTGHWSSGCDSVWGVQCSVSLRNFLRHALMELSTSGCHYENPLDTILQQLRDSSPAIPFCPSSIFQVAYIPVHTFANDSQYENRVQAEPPGGWHQPWETWYLPDTGAEEQAIQVAVGILSHAPAYGSPPPASLEEIEVEFVCVRAPKETYGFGDWHGNFVHP